MLPEMIQLNSNNAHNFIKQGNRVRFNEIPCEISKPKMYTNYEYITYNK